MSRYVYFVSSSRRHTRCALVTGVQTCALPIWTDWLVHLIDTGPSTMTGGRIKRLAPVIGNETFMVTWADGVSDVDLRELLDFHRAHGKLATDRKSVGRARVCQYV